MLAENERKANILVGIGFVGQLIADFVVPGTIPTTGLIVMLIATGVFIWGCCEYAVGKGYERFVGALGIFSLIGLIILAVMPDRNKDTVSET